MVRAAVRFIAPSAVHELSIWNVFYFLCGVQLDERTREGLNWAADVDREVVSFAAELISVC